MSCLLLCFHVAISPPSTQTLFFSWKRIPKAHLYVFHFPPESTESNKRDDDFVFCWLTGSFSAAFRDCICHGVSGHPYNELHVGCRVGVQRQTLLCPLQTLSLAWPLLPGRQVGLLPTLLSLQAQGWHTSFQHHRIQAKTSLKQNLSKRKLRKPPRLQCLKGGWCWQASHRSGAQKQNGACYQERWERSLENPGPLDSPWPGQLSALARVISSSSLANI